MQNFLIFTALISTFAAFGGYILAPAEGHERLTWMLLAFAFPPLVVLLPLLPTMHLLPGHR